MEKRTGPKITIHLNRAPTAPFTTACDTTARKADGALDPDSLFTVSWGHRDLVTCEDCKRVIKAREKAGYIHPKGKFA